MKFTDDQDLTPQEKVYFTNLLQSKLQSIEAGTVSTRKKMLNSNTMPDQADRANDVSSQATSLRIHDRQLKLVKKIKKALSRIENNEYNVCSNCEESIGKKRLEARPVTDMCIHCKEKEEQYEYWHN